MTAQRTEEPQLTVISPQELPPYNSHSSDIRKSSFTVYG